MDGMPAEEKLLRLIKGRKSAQTPDAKNAAAKAKSKHFSLKKYLTLNNIMITGFVIATAFLIISFINTSPVATTNNLADIKSEKATVKDQEAKSEKKPYDYYLSSIKGRDIFSVSSEPQKTEKLNSGAEASSMKDLNLMGVISGESPQAIIEDKKTQKSYYVSKGQSVGDFEVEDIKEGKVILIKDGKKFELTL